jgi:virulence-associated protein VapD
LSKLLECGGMGAMERMSAEIFNRNNKTTKIRHHELKATLYKTILRKTEGSVYFTSICIQVDTLCQVVTDTSINIAWISHLNKKGR